MQSELAISLASSKVNNNQFSRGGDPIVVIMIQKDNIDDKASSLDDTHLSERSLISTVGGGEEGPQASPNFVDLTRDHIFHVFSL